MKKLEAMKKDKDIKAKNFDKIIKWGRKKHGDTTED